MKLIPKILRPVVLSILMTSATTATAGDDPANESARISQAAALYSEASMMEIDSLQRTGLLKQSELILRDVIEKNPQSLDAHRKLMGVYLQKRDYRNAIAIMQNTITLSPGDPKLYIALAILYDHKGAYEYALPLLDQALLLDPGQKLAEEYKTTIKNKMAKQAVALGSAHAK